MPAYLYPMLLDPTLHVKVWGGDQLRSKLGKDLPDDAPYGESWELHDTARILNGSQAGKTLAELIAQYGHAIIGTAFDPADGLPLLVKLLDASRWLSVQVHPNDAQANALEGDPRGKSEAWFILAATETARLVIGLKAGTSREQMAQAIREQDLEALLVYAYVKAGDVLNIEANTVHAIGPGIMLYEVQQSSDVTYRLYDWGRVGLDGQPRTLHIEKGTQVANIDHLPTITHPDTDAIVSGRYFQTHRHCLNNTHCVLQTAGHFQALTCFEGAFTVTGGGEQITLGLGQTVFIPSGLPEYTLAGTGWLLRSHMVIADD